MPRARLHCAHRSRACFAASTEHAAHSRCGCSCDGRRLARQEQHHSRPRRRRHRRPRRRSRHGFVAKTSDHSSGTASRSTRSVLCCTRYSIGAWHELAVAADACGGSVSVTDARAVLLSCPLEAVSLARPCPCGCTCACPCYLWRGESRHARTARSASRHTLRLCTGLGRGDRTPESGRASAKVMACTPGDEKRPGQRGRPKLYVAAPRRPRPPRSASS